MKRLASFKELHGAGTIFLIFQLVFHALAAKVDQHMELTAAKKSALYREKMFLNHTICLNKT